MNVKINIGEILTKSWQIIWKFKVLWIFGILAGCAGGNNNNFNFNGNSGGGGGGNGGNGNGMEPFNRFFGTQPDMNARDFLAQYAGIITGVILLLCVLWFVFYFLGMMGKTGLIKGASKADDGATTMSFGELWTESTPYFWRMLGLSLLIGLPFLLLIIILLVIFGFGLFSASSAGMSGMGIGTLVLGMLGVFIAVMCVIGILSMIVGMVLEQAYNAIVLEDLGVFAGLSRGWEIFKSSVVSVIIIAVILGFIGGIISLIVAIPLLAIIVPAGIGMAVAGSGSLFIPIMLGLACFVVYLPVLLTASGMLNSYRQSVWTLTYRRLAAPAQPAKVEAIPTV